MRAALIVGLLCCAGLLAQERATGVVTSVSRPARLMTLETEAGEQATIALQEDTTYVRVAPGGRDVRNAERITLGAIEVGDRVLALGREGSAGTIVASSVVVLGKTASKSAPDAVRQDNRQKLITGAVVALNAAAREITVSADNVPAIIAADTAAFKRYAPDSPRYLDAELSSFDQIRIGNQLRATGERRGERFEASEIVFGSFRNLAGRVIAVNTATRIVTVHDLMARQPWEVVITENSLVRRLPAEAAAKIAGRVRGAVPAPGDPGLHGELEELPPLSIGQLQPGDVVLIAATEGGGPARVTAVALLTGVEPILAAAPLRADPLTGQWDFNADLTAGAR
jgi:hypothetical protein